MEDRSTSHCNDAAATPVVEACRRRGLFDLLDAREFRGTAQLIDALNANPGPFTIALEVLEAEGWVECDGDGAYRTTKMSPHDAPGAAPDDLVRDADALLFGEVQAHSCELVVDADHPVNEALQPLTAELPRHYLDAHGRLVDALAVLTAWQRHFATLDAPVSVTGRHASSPLQRLAGQVPVSAEAFLLLAASAGLFNEGPAQRQPLSADPCEVSVHELVRRDYVVRHATANDLGRLWELEQLCWQHTRTPQSQLAARVATYPQGQFVLERDGQVLGTIYSQRIADDGALATRTAADVHELHDPSGSTVQLLAVNIDPRVQNVSYGDQLLEFMLQRCGLMTGVTKVVGVTLCKSYRAEEGVAFEEYIRREGSGQDPVLAFHFAHGAEVVRPVPGYRPEDAANLNNGVLVAYDILHRTPRRNAVAAEVQQKQSELPEVEPFVRAEAAKLLASAGSDVDLDRPLMEMGLDSADLMTLQRRCEAAFGLQLQTGFFFEYTNLRKVVGYLTAQLAPAEPAAVAAEPPREVVASGPVEVVESEPEELVDDEPFDPAEESFAAGDIAVIGMSCKLPGGIDAPEQLWPVLTSAQCVVSSFPRSRRDWPSGTEYPAIDQGGFVEDADAFDAAFFRISPAEALITDPQQRMLLEVAWSCLEDAGIVPADLQGSKTGVFVGASNADYSRLVQEAGLEIEAHHGVGNSLAILANRISYFFDLSGPSLVVDTACSGSLVALHAAVQSLRSGECTSALAGGVNLISHPDLSVAYHKAGMLAADGRCKVFDAKADGYVRSEGAVVLMLKPLRAAIADGNQIHAVIRGTATNHGGLAGGLTVPNPQKQKELLIAAWTDAGIAPQDLTYIEAHGTGTSLGDPIELQGIRSAYDEMTAPGSVSGRCAIGSVKSNLGHLESAAGITGLLKVILSLRHRQIPASANFTKLNPKIQLDGTPFFIQNRLRAWEGGKRPRLAAVSSFGSGGTNAHAVVQEYRRAPRGSNAAEESLFVLSAANEDRLRVYAGRVIDWLERQGTAANFADAIYTWQAGRAAMKQRLAVKVKDPLDLASKLKEWLAGTAVADAWSGPHAQTDSAIHRVWRTRAGHRVIEHASIERDLDALGALWSSGLTVDWRKLYDDGEQRPATVSLPTYPFARDRYWPDMSATKPRQVSAKAAAPVPAAAGVLHPLLHVNSSDLGQQRYSTILSGDEFFLADHQVRADGRNVDNVLPGVAYLEMARAAVEQALPARPASMMLELRNTVWVQPIVVDAPTQVRIALSAGGDDEIDFEIYTHDADRELVHCQGRAVLRHEPASSTLDLEGLAARMHGAVDPRCVYPAFSRMGLVYGPSFQGITSVVRGNAELLAHVRLPHAAEAAFDEFVLHPSVMDGAVQAAVGLIDGWSDYAIEPRLPFALESLRVLGRCSREMVAWVRHAPASRTGDHLGKLDIDLCDQAGSVRVEMRGLSLRAAGREKTAASLLIPLWQTSRLDTTAGSEYTQHHVLLCEGTDVDPAALESLLPESRCARLESDPEQNLGARYTDQALACFERIQEILRGKPHVPVLVHVVAGGEEPSLLAGLAGLLKTAALENPQFIGQVVLVPRAPTADELARQLQDEKGGPLDPVVRYDRGTREVLRWQPVAPNQEQPAVAYREAGVYLITGGLGALGLVFAKDILEQAHDARVILTGRSAPNADKQSLLQSLGARASYRQLDLGNADDVARMVTSIVQEYGRLDGILHCAGMISDKFILRKERAEFLQVLAPKVAGTFHLDLATRDLSLDFFVLFSSIAGAMGNLGQADYAAANAFMDHFAECRNRQMDAGKRHGRTRSINWPLWQAGGMGNDAATRELMQHTTGMRPLKTAMGLQAFHRIMTLPYDQLVVVEGDSAQVRRALSERTAAPREQSAKPVIQADRGELAAKTQEFLRRELSAILKLQAGAIDPNAAMDTYGIDSIVAMRLTRQLEKTFGSLPKTLFFEYRSLAELTGFLIEEHAWRLEVLFSGSASAGIEVDGPRTSSPDATAAVARLATRARVAASGAIAHPEPIAIIGLSGRYPAAYDLGAYWRNLRDGKDCIVEVPKERWDWRSYYTEDRTKSGRHYSKWGGFIEGVDEFDPLFFNIAPREAKYIDPQERLFLQHAWMSIEDAGYTRAALQVPEGQDLPGQAGVYVGVMYSEYQMVATQAHAEELRMGFAGYLASIANRVSYALNLHGPSMTVDTMCSSSLTAIHLACQDLRQGRTSMAIAGGVNVSVHPNKYLMLSAGQFISSDGHCQSFGEGGDGYIPGEGVGAVVLKRLSDAKRDGDHIYGVILGSALNHGGRTNGYTVPNPQAQAAAIGRALSEARVDARHVSYLEAHGTGTKLGDPIEIAALSKAFQRLTGDTGFCLLGSAKSNIGHCESAAGIAGLTKVLLQMQHQQIVPSLHSAQLNPHIDFARTPFVVNQTLRPWEQPVVDGRKLPRIAGLSSFGAGGSNAHMIVEEYQAPPQPKTAGPVAIVLAARTSAQLQQKAVDLLELVRAQGSAIDLASMAWTLQTGREPMDERLAFIVSSVEQLSEKLAAWIAGERTVDDTYHGHAKRNNDALALFTNDSDLSETIDKWLAARKLGKLLNLWVQGLDPDWRKLYGEVRPRRMSLPAYPFARERYWIDVTPRAQVAAAPAQAASVLHPLLHANVSDLNGQRYRSTFTGTEPFLSDRQVPAEVWLEMARAAVEHAARVEGTIELRDVEFSRPLLVDGAKDVDIALAATDDGDVEFEIFSDDFVHCHGRAILSGRADDVKFEPAPRVREHVLETAAAPAGEPAVIAPSRREIAFVPAASAEQKTRVAIALAAPSAVQPAAATARMPITLSTTIVSAAPAPSSVRLYDHGNGVFSIDLASPAVAAHVVQALERAKQEPSLRVVLASGIERAAGAELHRALLSFPYPVIGVVQDGATGPAFLSAASCDFMVCNEDARYGTGDAPAPGETDFFAARLGALRAHDLIGAAPVTGRELRARAWTVPFLPPADVESHAQQLAASLATKSPDALRLLKQHLTRKLTAVADIAAAIEEETASPATIAPSERIRVATPADRVLALTFGIGDARDVIADLARIFDDLRRDGWYKAVVLGSDDPEFLFAIPDDVVREAQRLIAGSTIPVVAALSRNAKGSAWLIAQFCDACVYNRNGVYAAANIRPALARTAAAVFAHRLGNDAAAEVLLTGADYSGAVLQQRTGVLRVADRDFVMGAAIELASSWARLPRTALEGWKSGGEESLRQKIERTPDVVSAEAGEEAAPPSIPLQSHVVTATPHADGVVVVKMEDRDAKNMFSGALMEGVREAFARIGETPGCKVVVLTGYDSYFASGGTKESLLSIQDGTAKFTDFDIYQAALDCRLPVIAAMQGHGIGAGWPMGMFADVVLLSEESQYVSPYMDYGFTPGAGATWILPEKLGPDLGRESLLTAQPVTGRALRERGVTLRVLPRSEVLPAAMTLAQQIARTPRTRLIELKEQLTAATRQALEETVRLELAMHERTFVGRSDTLATIESKFERQQAEAPAAPAEQPRAAHHGDALREVAKTLRTLLAGELQIRESDVDDGTQFVDLGLDSISGVTWVRKINEKYRTAIEATKVYSYPTLAQLSRYVRDEAEKNGTLPAAAPLAVTAETAAPRVEIAAPKPAAATRSMRRRRSAAKPEPPAARRTPAIAVIGMAGEFPRANDLEQYWQNIAEGRNCVDEVPRERWDVGAYYQPGDATPGKTYSRWAGTIDDYDRFDPLFFNISPTEAEHMDPQQRRFLQACWHTVENAGYDTRRLSGSKCGVFVGCTDGDYHQQSRRHQLSAQGFTGSAMSILAARVSYLLNLQGPCISIDTACSSSLVAIAQACDSLVAGSSDLALAGGVYVMVGPEMHIKTAQAGMLSPDGKCFTFDQRANGFVPGEGAGAVLLKRLEDAERDGDLIHAVIRGWGVNQDGKTNGITAPNPDSQTRLEQEVYDRYGIDPAQVGVVEAHGTGTRLGDPIEVEGLRNAFGKYTKEKDYCALGSVKSNIGHCLAAAGIAGVLKLVLALRNRQLPPAVHFERLNEHIELKDTPFYVNRQLRDWTARGGRERLAATSSFGFSGTNAHIVLGEYTAPDAPRPTQSEPALIPLSARTPEQLRQKAADLLAWTRKEPRHLHDVAYTLQIGREPMEERLGIVAGSTDDLARKLESWLQGERVEEVHAGQARRGGDDAAANEAAVSRGIAEGRHGELLDLWVNGCDVDWNRLYPDVRPRRVELPLYPFARERYWIEPESTARAVAPAMLHPLLHSNTSDLNGQRFSSTFSGEEFFLSDHRVRTSGAGAQKVLPGAAYLEMARVAVEQAWPGRDAAGALELHNTVWLKPAVVTEPRRVSIALSADDDGRIDYEVFSGDGDAETLHCQGEAAFVREPLPAPLDLGRLQRQMVRGHLSASDVYEKCDRMGLHYGPAHRALTAVHLGQGELLAELRLPAALAAGVGDYVLHPSLLDSAFQAVAGLLAAPGREPSDPPVPFALESLRIVTPCPAEMVVWVRRNGAKFDIDMADRRGNLCVRIQGFAVRVLYGEATDSRLTINENRPDEPRSPFDDAFYERLIADVASRSVSVDEAVEVG